MRSRNADTAEKVKALTDKLETGDSAFTYISKWSRDKELEELKTSLDCISRTSAEMIYAIESCIPELSMSQDKPEMSEKYFSR